MINMSPSEFDRRLSDVNQTLLAQTIAKALLSSEFADLSVSIADQRAMPDVPFGGLAGDIFDQCKGGGYSEREAIVAAGAVQIALSNLGKADFISAQSRQRVSF